MHQDDSFTDIYTSTILVETVSHRVCVHVYICVCVCVCVCVCMCVHAFVDVCVVYNEYEHIDYMNPMDIEF